MQKTTQIFLIILLSHYVNSNLLDVDLEEWLSRLSKRMDSCMYYFQYERIDDFINGHLTLPNITIGDTVKLTFFRLDDEFHPRFNGIFLPDENPQDIINKVQNGKSISYRVDFPLTLNVPQLIKIFINDNELCATKHNYSYDILMLQHTLEIINDSLPVYTYNINIPNFADGSTCGLVNTEIANNEESLFAVSALEITRGEHPWLTAIYKNQINDIHFLCAGSLVTSNIVLAAAHCFQGPNLNADQIVVMLGQNNLINSTKDIIFARKIIDLIFHPEYKPELDFSDADIALLKLKDHVSFTKFIKPICLWNRPAEESLIVDHPALVAGWGSNKNITSVFPKKIKINIVSETECHRSSAANIALTSSRTLCAENNADFEFCERFYGSGLMIYRYGRWILRGIIPASTTSQEYCGLSKYTVYCDIAKHRSWLENYIKPPVQIITESVEDICGRSDTTESRSEHPWLAAVYGKELTGVMFYCTGALISSQSVVAPAYCFTLVDEYLRPPEQIRVYLGRYDLNNIREDGVQARDVSTLNYHPDFKPTTKTYLQNSNIVLLQLKSPVSFTKYVKPICLWHASAYESQMVENVNTLSSWDILEVYNDSSTVPQSIKVDIVPIEKCQSLGLPVNTSLPILCVPRFGNKMEGVLMLKRNGRWLLRGMTSLRNLFFSYKSYDYWIYTDFGEYFSWIQRNMLL